ncbi:MAG: hypothetical protein FWE03_03120 [Firmicutes bacterium]|nr:hypothetical protein [Bacillota bacterium]
MDMNIKNKPRPLFIISMILICFAIVLIPLFIFSACVVIPTYIRFYDYEFGIEDDYLIWNEEGEYVYSSYDVYVFESGYDPLKTMFNKHPDRAVSEWTMHEDSIGALRVSGARGRVPINILGLTAGLNIVRVISSVRGFEPGGGCAGGGNNIKFAGFFEVYVAHNAVVIDYDFNINQDLSFYWIGQEYNNYAVYALNSSDNGFRFIQMSESGQSINLDRLGLTEDENTIKVEVVLSAEYDGDKLLLNSKIALFEFDLIFNDYCPDFDFRVGSNGHTLFFDRGDNPLIGNHRIYISNSGTDGFIFSRITNAASVDLRGGAIEGHNAVKVAGWISSSYADSVVTIYRRVGEWSFEFVLAEGEFNVNAIVRVGQFYEWRSSGCFREGGMRYTDEWAIFLDGEYRLDSSVSIDRRGRGNFGRVWISDNVIRRSNLSRGRNTIRIYEARRYIFEDGRLYQIDRVDYIEVRRRWFSRRLEIL